VKQSLVRSYDELDRASVAAMDQIVVLSERVQKQMAEHYGVKSVIVRPGVSRPEGRLSRDELRARLGLPDTTFTLLTLCMLMPRRRLEDAIQAVRLLVDQGADVHYIIAGSHAHSPGYVQTIRELVQTLSLTDHVTLTGEVAEDELGSYYEACDAFIWPADENQSWSLASMEAMLHRRPVLVSSANGFAEVLTDEKHALLFPPRVPEALAERVLRLKADAVLYQRLADEAETLVRNDYSWRSNALSMLGLFDAAIIAQGQAVQAHTARPVP
jgi:glycosyltransferase involved in cell wall biosynthesis